MNEAVAGIDIGGTKIAIALEAFDGARRLSRQFPTRVELGPHTILEHILAAVRALVAEAQATLVAVGIGCAGPLDIERGLVLSPINLPGWHEFPIAQLTAERLGVLTVLENDANAAALGEHIFGAGRGFKDIVYLTISTGIGGGIINDGQIMHGIGGGAGEVGHMTVLPDGPACGCGARGCLEALCAGPAIARRARALLTQGRTSMLEQMVGSPEEITAQLVAAAAARGDSLAAEVWAETVRLLAVGVGNVITLLAPEAVILGGGVAATGEQLLGPLRPLVRERVRMLPVERVQLLSAALGAESGVCGALVMARRAYQLKHS